MRKSIYKACALLMITAMVFLSFSCGDSAPQQQAQAAAASTAAAGTIPPLIDASLPADTVTLRVAYDDPILWPDSEPCPDPEHAFALFFKDYVESRSSGKIKIDMFGIMKLGTYRQTCEMVQNGSIDLNIGTGSMAAFFPKIELITIPYIFASDDIAEEFFNNSPYWAELMTTMRDVGFQYLGIGQNGSRNFTNNVREIRSPADCKGLKFRVMESPVYVRMIESLGANAVPISWNEVYTALQTGVVDGHENAISSISLGKIYEVQKYLTMDAHIWSENLMVMNRDKYDGLTLGAQQILKQGARMGSEANNVADKMVSNIVKFKTIAKNMQVYYPSPAEKEQFRAATQPAVVDYLKGTLGAETVENFIREVQLAEVRAGWRR
jgi:C4-dicarboxylate-binding protein DctP